MFRQGDIGTNWYAVLSGSLDVSVSDTTDTKVGTETDEYILLYIYPELISAYRILWPSAHWVLGQHSESPF